MERPEEEPLSRVTYLIRIIEKHIKKMSEALEDLEKTDLPRKHFPDDNSGQEEPADESGGIENPVSKP